MTYLWSNLVPFTMQNNFTCLTWGNTSRKFCIFRECFSFFIALNCFQTLDCISFLLYIWWSAMNILCSITWHCNIQTVWPLAITSHSHFPFLGFSGIGQPKQLKFQMFYFLIIRVNVRIKTYIRFSADGIQPFSVQTVTFPLSD